MDPVKNPYAPGAGTKPPELAGRDALLREVDVALQRIRKRRPTKSVIMVGLRGVGKTVLLDRMRDMATAQGAFTMRVESPEDRSLPAMLAPQLRSALLSLSTRARAKHLSMRALGALAGFAKALRAKYDDIEVGFDFEPQPGIADNGNLEHDLAALLGVAGEAAAADESALIMFVDEMQYVPEEQLASLISALHASAQQSLPVALVGAGLPQLRGRMGNAKSYAERLFDFPEVGPLSVAAARQAFEYPARAEGAAFEPAALDKLIEQTQGYPYFVQEWGKHVWDAAEQSPITSKAVEEGGRRAIAALDTSFFRVRFDRLTPSEKNYLRAMAELGPGPHRSGDIAAELRRAVTSLGPTRQTLMSKGMIWSPSHGDTAFTVPLFDQFMHRIMPGDAWRTA